MASRSNLDDEIELIQKRPLKEDIFDVLHDKIVSGKYKPGQWLRQDDIATQLGVSMTPVREAFDFLRRIQRFGIQDGRAAESRSDITSRLEQINRDDVRAGLLH